MDRRDFLRRIGFTALGLGLGGAPTLSISADTPPDLGQVAYQLSWIKNFQFAGSYIADTRKYYQSSGG